MGREWIVGYSLAKFPSAATLPEREGRHSELPQSVDLPRREIETGACRRNQLRPGRIQTPTSPNALMLCSLKCDFCHIRNVELRAKITAWDSR